jgi:hypothetical protein
MPLRVAIHGFGRPAPRSIIEHERRDILARTQVMERKPPR